MNVFVTGSTGLLGNNVVRALEAAGHRVVGLTRSADKGAWLLGDTDAELVVGDMRSVDEFAPHLRGCDAVIHTAAYFREYYQPGDHAGELEAINIEGTLALLRAADEAGVQRFVHVSSAGAVGEKPDGSPGDEDTPPAAHQLRNLYFKSKFDGDAKIRRFEPVGAQAMRVVEILPGWMWGPGDAGPTGAGRLVLDLLAGDVPAVPKGGANTVDARDVADAIVRAIERPAPRDRYIVAGEFRRVADMLGDTAERAGVRAPRRIPAWLALTVAHVSEAWARVTGGVPKVPLEGVRIFVHEHRVSSARAQHDLGVTFRDFDETAQDVLDWYAQRGVYEVPSVSAAT